MYVYIYIYTYMYIYMVRTICTTFFVVEQDFVYNTGSRSNFVTYVPMFDMYITTNLLILVPSLQDLGIKAIWVMSKPG